MKITTSLLVTSLLLFLIPGAVRRGRVPQEAAAPAAPAEQSTPGSEVTVPRRPASPLHNGEQGAQRSEIEFVPLTRTVTVKFQVEDPNGYFLPNIRRENFAVYEDGVRQKNVTVEVEHAPVSVALLMEFGGRYHELNKALGLEVPTIGRELLGVIGRDDRVAVFKYDAKLDTLVDFNQGHEVLDRVFNQLVAPNVSEADFYDALLETLNRMLEVSGRKAIIVVSSGVDTFSKANYHQILQAAQSSATPIYAIGLTHLMVREAAVYGAVAPFARIDWGSAEKQLETLAKVSGGRAYVLQTDAEIPAIYDDIMENLSIRYVITYVSSNPATTGPPRQIRVELIDPKTGEPLRIRDSNGKLVLAKLFVQDSYSLSAPSGSLCPRHGTEKSSCSRES
jgi:Ca-activated chloride channel family protein